KFAIASVFMWTAPLLILQAYKRDLLPGFSSLSPEVQTIVCGLLAVVSVNVVIAFYILSAMREPPTSTEPKPDPEFVSRARASVEAL
ncbi:hypothetical protein SELMODRAFT_49779, partial [Selaginella moellendorffii]